MIALFRIFLLELTSLVRSRTLPVLSVLSWGWVLAAPHLLSGDGTAAGAREIVLRYSFGGVTALLAVVLAITAAGSVAFERSAKRLQLTLVRPVRLPLIALGRMLAYVSCAAVVLGGAVVIELGMRRDEPCCRHVVRPSLPPPIEVARAEYERMMSDPSTSPEVKAMKKSVVLRALVDRVADNYESVKTNAVAAWSFPDLADYDKSRQLTARLRFSTSFGMREEVSGSIAFESSVADFRRSTEAEIELPLVRSSAESKPENVLYLTNLGSNQILLRPRRDVEMLVEADGFGWNLVRAALMLLASISLVIAFAVLLSAGLGRPVALFTAISVLVAGELAPSICDRYPDPLETDRIDAFCMDITRFVSSVTHPFGDISPLVRLAADERIETRELLRCVLSRLVLAPIVLSLLAGLVLRRKTE